MVLKTPGLWKNPGGLQTRVVDIDPELRGASGKQKAFKAWHDIFVYGVNISLKPGYVCILLILSSHAGFFSKEIRLEELIKIMRLIIIDFAQIIITTTMILLISFDYIQIE